jgi:hypothetical protein
MALDQVKGDIATAPAGPETTLARLFLWVAFDGP